MGFDIKGQFYEEGQQPFHENRYLLERILGKRKTPQGNQEFLVKWKSWQTKFNSVVKEEDCDYIEKSKDESQWGIQADITQ